jgi:hypothetical protein
MAKERSKSKDSQKPKGKFGKYTREEMMEFQRRKNLPAKDLLEALKEKRKELGDDTVLEKVILGDRIIETTEDGGTKEIIERGIRDKAQEFVDRNAEMFDPNRMTGLAGRELLETAVTLSERAIEANTSSEASSILVKLKSIQDIAQKSTGAESYAVAMKIEELIKPVVENLKKRASFSSKISERLSETLQSIPERLAAKIPVIGGLLSGALREKRESTELQKQFTGRLTREISERGSRTRGGRLEFGGSLGERYRRATGGGGMESSIPFPRSILTPRTRARMGGEQGAGFLAEGMTRLLRVVGSNPRKGVINEELVKIRKALAGGGGGGGGEGGGIADMAMNALGMPSLGSMFVLGGGGGGAAGAGAGAGLFAGLLAPTTAVGAAGLGSVALYGGAGLAIGTGLAYGVNKGIDSVFGTDLAERQFSLDTYNPLEILKTPGEIMDAGLATIGMDSGTITREMALEKTKSDPKVIEAAKQDWRRLPTLVREERITPEEGLQILGQFEKEYGAGEDTQFVRDRIKQEAKVLGKVLPPDSTSPVSQMANATAAAREDLANTQQATTTPQPNTTNANVTTNNVSNTTVINDPGGVRNNEPTVRRLETSSY